MFGRKVIYSSETEINRDTLIKVLKEVYPIHQQNSRDIDYLYNYYRGNQPILNREKKVRPEINNRVVENHALEIVNFKKAMFSVSRFSTLGVVTVKMF